VRVVGHSLGGGVAILVDWVDPSRIERFLLCEAVVFAEFAPPDGDRPPMAEIARKRRAVWPDRDTVRRSYASREPLCRLDPEALDAYIHYGVVDRHDGQVELACPPEVEAEIFEMTPTALRGSRPAWDHLPRLAGRAVIASGAATSLPPRFELQAEVSGCPHVVVEGSHFFPQEQLEATAVLVRTHLG
jgi:pimeloyl-ACP methyl ester carboxylesterase